MNFLFVIGYLFISSLVFSSQDNAESVRSFELKIEHNREKIEQFLAIQKHARYCYNNHPVYIGYDGNRYFLNSYPKETLATEIAARQSIIDDLSKSLQEHEIALLTLQLPRFCEPNFI